MLYFFHHPWLSLSFYASFVSRAGHGPLNKFRVTITNYASFVSTILASKLASLAAPHKGEGRWLHHPPYPPIDAPHQSAHLPSLTLAITPSGQACGARVTGVYLTRPPAPETNADIRAAWHDPPVPPFPATSLSDHQLAQLPATSRGLGPNAFN